MRRYVILVGLALLGGCDRSTSTDPRKAEAAPTIPIGNAMTFTDAYNLRVPRSGDFLWNGVAVSAPVLEDYLREFALHAGNTAHLTIAFEPGVPPDREKWVRDRVVASGLCRRDKCFEVPWIVKGPIID